MKPTPSLVWFRLDLRLQDNPALHAAVQRGGAVIPVFIWSPKEEGAWPPGAASRWWLHQSLKCLQSQLDKLGSPLVLCKGSTLPTLSKLAVQTGAAAVFWNRRYEPAPLARDLKIQKGLRAQGLEVKSFKSATLFEPGEILNRAGSPFKVFTPFYRACLAAPEPEALLSAPKKILAPKIGPKSLPLEALKLEPRLDWTGGLRHAWEPGESGAELEWEKFLDFHLSGYLRHRDHPALLWTSRLSPHLHFGEISPRRIFNDLQKLSLRKLKPEMLKNAEGFLRQLGWREFAHHLLFHFPQTAETPLRPEFKKFPWRKDSKLLKAWQRGRTGYPIVDAGMRELWSTGWMHNRVRMIVASFLVKDLLLPWQEGAKWFWDTLVDADLANNTLGWQWSAKILNPVTQGKKFDPKGDYIRRWVPELAELPEIGIHRPWAASAAALAKAGVELGVNYPEPVVDHGGTAIKKR